MVLRGLLKAEVRLDGCRLDQRFGSTRTEVQQPLWNLSSSWKSVHGRVNSEEVCGQIRLRELKQTKDVKAVRLPSWRNLKKGSGSITPVRLASVIGQSLESDTKAMYMSSKETESSSRGVHGEEVLENSRT